MLWLQSKYESTKATSEYQISTKSDIQTFNRSQLKPVCRSANSDTVVMTVRMRQNMDDTVFVIGLIVGGNIRLYGCTGREAEQALSGSGPQKLQNGTIPCASQ